MGCMAAVSSQPRPALVSSVALWQTNPTQADHGVFVKIVLNPTGIKAEAQEVRFPYKPDQESLESVIDELVDALQLGNGAHHKTIVSSIKSKMASKRMRIVQSSPIEQHSNHQKQKSKTKSKHKANKKRKHKHNSSNGLSCSAKHKASQNQNHCQNGGSNHIRPSLNLSPKKKLFADDGEFIFSPLSPLVVSPRTIH